MVAISASLNEIACWKAMGFQIERSLAYPRALQSTLCDTKGLGSDVLYDRRLMSP